MQLADNSTILMQSQIDELLKDAAERRGRDRQAFTMKQMIAPYDQGPDAEPAPYRMTQCHDLTTRGISFFWDSSPDFEMALIRLDVRSSPVIIRASVANCRKVEQTDGEYLVGCQFIERVEE